MSKQTYGEASTIHGQDPQSLIETILRSRIYESLYWKEYCHGLNAETLVERAVELQTIGGHYGNQRPTEFICLLLKLLQIQPEKEIVYELINNDDFKYLRALAAFYLRLTGNSIEIYTYLEPLLTDYRKLRRKLRTGSFQLTYIDEFIDELLRSERVCDIILPPLMKRHILEESDELPPYISLLEDELMEEEEGKSEGEREEKGKGVMGVEAGLSDSSDSESEELKKKKFEVYSDEEGEEEMVDPKKVFEVYSEDEKEGEIKLATDDKESDKNSIKEDNTSGLKRDFKSRSNSDDSKRGRHYSKSRSSSQSLKRKNRYSRSRSRSIDSRRSRSYSRSRSRSKYKSRRSREERSHSRSPRRDKDDKRYYRHRSYSRSPRRGQDTMSYRRNDQYDSRRYRR